MEKILQSMSPLIMPILLIFILYFILLRPQQQKMRRHQELLNQLKKNDRVLTAGGFIGTIDSVDGENVRLALADSVIVTMRKAQILEILSDKSHALNKSDEAKKSKKMAKAL
jgi:preprotein translocase subunit YajC